MIWILIESSVTVLRNGYSPPGHKVSTSLDFNLPQLVLPQLALALAAVTSFHVQVITRISSGYPMWYPVIASWIIRQAPPSPAAKYDKRLQWLLRGMIMYAIIQGLLFANFLPPA